MRAVIRPDVRFGSKADMCSAKRHVRFTPNSGHSGRQSACLLCAMWGRLKAGKNFLHVCSIGRCSHVFGRFVRHTGPLGIMPGIRPHLAPVLQGRWESANTHTISVKHCEPAETILLL
jgi:hypothetical protein